MRLLQIDSLKEIKHVMQDIAVDHHGIKIMAPKAIIRLLRIDSLSSIAANILKQEMLSLGGDVAVSRDALTGRKRKTGCLVIGSLSQYSRLTEKLSRQPFGLHRLSTEISRLLTNYHKDNFVLELGRHRLSLGRRARIMGIVNLTPDSFSGDGLYQGTMKGSRIAATKIVGRIEKMVREGADIIDIGGESSRPGAKTISVKEELRRTIPIVKMSVKIIKVPVSIDTRKPEVARQALDNGAVMVNDITALKNPAMAKVISKYKAGVILMHMKGNPATMQEDPVYESLIDEIVAYLNRSIDVAMHNGIDRQKIIIDPGIGFGKTCAHNLAILKRLKEFKVLGVPILVGTSRKSFIGSILNLGPQDRIFGTVATCVLAAKNGASILRVHDIKEVNEAIKVLDAMGRL